MKSSLLRNSLGLITVLGIFEGAGLKAVGEMNRSLFSAPLRQAAQLNSSGSPAYYYPDLDTWTTQKPDGKYETYHLITVEGRGLLVSRDGNRAYFLSNK